MKRYRLSELSELTGTVLEGDGDCEVTHVDTIQDASAGAICFLANRKYHHYLQVTQASAVILSRDSLGEHTINALISDNPYLTFARIAQYMNPTPVKPPGIHPSAVVHETANVSSDAYVGPQVVIEAGSVIGSGTQIGPGCIIGERVSLGAGSRLVANVTLCSDTQIGEGVLIHPGAVIGSDGFGLASDQGVWEKVPQLGRVVIGNNVEIGANTTIDRGALRNTVIGNGVKLDNQIQIAHNVEIGDHTAIAGCAGIAGSTHIGKNCSIGGGVGIAGHLEIGDNVHFSGQSLVTRSFKEPGYYSGNFPAIPNGDWRKSVARIRHLESLFKRVKHLEQKSASRDQDDVQNPESDIR